MFAYNRESGGDGPKRTEKSEQCFLAMYKTFRNSRQVSPFKGVFHFVVMDTPELLSFFRFVIYMVR